MATQRKCAYVGNDTGGKRCTRNAQPKWTTCAKHHSAGKSTAHSNYMAEIGLSIGDKSANGVWEVVAVEPHRVQLRETQYKHTRHASATRWYKKSSPTLAKLFPPRGAHKTHTKTLADGTKIHVHTYGQLKEGKR